MQGEMIYIPREMMGDVARMKAARANGMSYEISYETSYDSKEERTDKEKRTKKEINKKEEKGRGGVNKKIQKNTFFPSFEEVKEYYEEEGFKEFEVEEFFDKYSGNDWKDKDQNPISDWQAVMRNWERYRIDKRNKQQDNEKRRQTKGAGAKNGATREELQQEIIEYLDTHYPVADKGAEAVVAQGMERDATLGEMARVLGTAPVLRVVIKRLFVTGYTMDMKPQMLAPSTLDKTAKRLCEKGWLLTMRQVGDFLQRCMDGVYGDFRGGLKTTTVLPALKQFTMNNSQCIIHNSQLATPSPSAFTMHNV